MKEIHRLAQKIREKKIINAINARIDRPKSRAVMPRATKKRERERSVSRLRAEFEDLGVDMSDVRGCHFTRTRSTSRSRPPLKKARLDSEGIVRSSSRTPRDQSGVRDTKVRVDSLKQLLILVITLVCILWKVKVRIPRALFQNILRSCLYQ